MTLKSLENQLYPLWKVRTSFDQVSEDFVLFVDCDVVLRPHALYLLAQSLNQTPQVNLLYGDDDQITPQGMRTRPHFKPDWDPDYLRSTPFLRPICLWRTQKLRSTLLTSDSKTSITLEGTLPLAQTLSSDEIRHIPFILAHAQERFREAHTIEPINNKNDSLTSDQLPLVSLIICTKDKVSLLRGLVDGILNETQYSPFEVLIIDNQSCEPATLQYFSQLTQQKAATIIRYDAPFNFSAMNNLGAKQAKGEILVFLNNDLLVIKPNWLKALIKEVTRPEIGAVGAKLRFPDDTIQHAGLTLGIGGIAGHTFKSLPCDTRVPGNRPQVVQRVSAVTGACLAVKKADFVSVGGFDAANLAVAFNDVDLCLRLMKKGLANLYTPHAELYHLESASRGSDMTPEKFPRFKREADYTQEKWQSLLQCDPYYNPNLSLLSEDFAFAHPPRVRTPWSAQPSHSKDSPRLEATTNLGEI